VKLCFDAGHAHLDGGVPSALETARELLVTTHLHDNRGERDDHLLPYEGTIDWSDAASRFCPPGTPLVLELKEPGRGLWVPPDVQAFAETLKGVRKVFEKFEQALTKD